MFFQKIQKGGKSNMADLMGRHQADWGQITWAEFAHNLVLSLRA